MQVTEILARHVSAQALEMSITNIKAIENGFIYIYVKQWSSNEWALATVTKG